MSLEILRKIGLSAGEIRVYEALLELGQSPLNRLHERIGIERRNIYDILNKLIERGLVAYVTENKRRLFAITHPNKILGYIDEKQGELQNVKEDVENLVPSIIAKFEALKPTTNAEIYRGIEGIKAVWEDMLNHSEVHWIGSGRYIPDKYPHFFAAWNKKRIKKHIRWHNLIRAELKGKTQNLLYEQVKFLPKAFSGNPTVIAIYGPKVVNFLFGKELFAFVIENKELADNYRRYHKYLWNQV